MAKQTTAQTTGTTENTEATNVEPTATGSLEEALKAKIVELEKRIEEYEAEIAQKNAEIEVLKDIQATQDEALAASTPSENNEEVVRYKLAEQGLTLVIIEGKYYATGNASLGGVPINDVEPDKLKELLELGTFFTELE